MSDLYEVSGISKLGNKKKIVLSQMKNRSSIAPSNIFGFISYKQPIGTDFEITFNCKLSGCPLGFVVTFHDGTLTTNNNIWDDDTGLPNYRNTLSLKIEPQKYNKSVSIISLYDDLNCETKNNYSRHLVTSERYHHTEGKHDYVISYIDQHIQLFIDGVLIFRVPINLSLALRSNSSVFVISGRIGYEKSKITIRDFCVDTDLEEVTVSRTTEYLFSNNGEFIIDKDGHKSYSDKSKCVELFGKYRFSSFTIILPGGSGSFIVGFLSKPKDKDGIFFSYKPGKFKYYQIENGKDIVYARGDLSPSNNEVVEFSITCSYRYKSLEFSQDDQRLLYFRIHPKFPEDGYITVTSSNDITEICTDLPKIQKEKNLLTSLPSELIALTNSYLYPSNILQLKLLSTQFYQMYSKNRIWEDYIKMRYCNFNINFEDDSELSRYLMGYLCGFDWRFLPLISVSENYHLYRFFYQKIPEYITLINNKKLHISVDKIYGIQLHDFRKQSNESDTCLSSFKNCKILHLAGSSKDDVIPDLTNFSSLKVLIITMIPIILTDSNLDGIVFRNLLYLNVHSDHFDLSNLCSIKFVNLVFLKISYEVLDEPAFLGEDPPVFDRKSSQIYFFKSVNLPKLNLLSINDRGRTFDAYDTILQTIIKAKLPVKYLEFKSPERFDKYQIFALHSCFQLPKLIKLGVPKCENHDFSKLKDEAKKLKIFVFHSE